MTRHDISPTDPAVATAGRLAATMGRVFFGLRRATRPNLGAPPLSSSEVDLLRLAREQPGIRMGEAAEALSLAPNTLTALVKRASESGFLRRARSTDDRRVVHLYLSTAGEARLTLWRDRRAETLAAALSDLPDDDRATLIAALVSLERLAERLEH